jgi:phenolic acid decarboxylase
MPISHKKLLFLERQANELQAAVYVDRSKNKDDEVKIFQNDLFLSDEKRFKKTKFKKFLAENFLQIFYVKEKGIF